MCSASGRGRDRAMAAMTWSRSSSESMGPEGSVKSSSKGALASIAASVGELLEIAHRVYRQKINLLCCLA